MNKLVLDQSKFNGLVAKLCRDIANSGWRPDYIVGLTRGGLLPAVMISHYFEVPMYALSVSLRDSATGPESNLWMAEDAFGYLSYEGETFPAPADRVTSDSNLVKNILIVDDINDTGATLNWIMKDWPNGCLPDDPHWNNVWNQNVRFAVVVDNLASQCTASMDYVGMEVNKAENDVWIDFPYEDWWTK